MLIASLHCNGGKVGIDAHWVRQHSIIGENERQDYFAVRIGTGDGEVTLFLSPDQLESLAVKLAQAAQDRSVVLAEETDERIAKRELPV